MWQTVCIVGTLEADIAYKILLKNIKRNAMSTTFLQHFYN